MIYFDRAETHWPVRVQLQIGSRVPAHCTASGKMYLSTLPPTKRRRILGSVTLQSHTPNTVVSAKALEAELADVRARGYATDNEEYIEGMVALAVAVRDAQQRLFATLSFHAPAMRIPFDSLEHYLPQLQQAAIQLGELLNE